MPSRPRAPSTLSRVQGPCGTSPSALVPRGLRPWSRAMPVSTPHSSRNTRRSGATPPTPASASAGHAARAAATSARPCSAACRLRLFHVQPHRRSARPTVQGCTRTPVRSASRSRHSAKVRWFASPSRPSNAASTSPVILGFGPPPIRSPPPPPGPAPAGPSNMIQPSIPPPSHVGRGVPTFSRFALARRYAARGLAAYVITVPDSLGVKADLNDLLRGLGVNALRMAVEDAERIEASSSARGRSEYQLELGSDIEIAHRVLERLDELYGPVLVVEGGKVGVAGVRTEFQP